MLPTAQTVSFGPMNFRHFTCSRADVKDMKARITLLAMCAATTAYAQSSIELQRAAIAKQQASVQRQREKARPARVENLSLPQAPVTIPQQPECSSVPAPDLNRMIEQAAAANQVEPEIVREVARQESAFNPCAVSSKGAEGLMQLMPATQAMLGVENPYAPEESLWAGARLLKSLLTRYDGNLALALSAYNAGPARVDATGDIPAIAETQHYVANILGRLNITPK